jgi:hypothetical protein
MTSNLVSTIRNSNNANAGANALLQVEAGGVNGGDPIIQIRVLSGATASLGLDNSDSDKLKIKFTSTPSDTPANTGVTMTNTFPPRVGINNDSPAYDLDITNTARARTLINTSAPPTVTPGVGMGTGPSGISVLGGQNGFYYAFTTGTSPVSGDVIFTVTPSTSYPTFMLPVFSAANAQSATDISKFYISATGNTTFTVRANGALTASTAYALFFVVLGY